MRALSHLTGCTRRTPCQRRGERRVASLLDAAVAEFAAAGWEATTMSAIARRAGAPIGSLYQFFPDKGAVARALRQRQIEHLQALWAELGVIARRRARARFVDRYVALTIAFVRSHPSFLPLLDAPASTLPVGARNRLRRDLEALLRALAPRLGAQPAARCAEVLLQLNKALMGAYARAGRRDRAWLAAEFRVLVRIYLDHHLAGRGRQGGD